MTSSRARMSRRLSSESGAELIEFAITFPLLLLIGLGIVDFGLLFQRFLVVTNAAREGARVAVLPGYGDGDVKARVDLYLKASGLNAMYTPPVINHPAPIAVGLTCAAVTTVTVTYPSRFSMVAGIASYFGVTGFADRTVVTATSQMRNEVPAVGCGP